MWQHTQIRVESSQGVDDINDCKEVATRMTRQVMGTVAVQVVTGVVTMVVRWTVAGLWQWLQGGQQRGSWSRQSQGWRWQSQGRGVMAITIYVMRPNNLPTPNQFTTIPINTSTVTIYLHLVDHPNDVPWHSIASIYNGYWGEILKE